MDLRSWFQIKWAHRNKVLHIDRNSRLQIYKPQAQSVISLIITVPMILIKEHCPNGMYLKNTSFQVNITFQMPHVSFRTTEQLVIWSLVEAQWLHLHESMKVQPIHFTVVKRDLWSDYRKCLKSNNKQLERIWQVNSAS